MGPRELLGRFAAWRKRDALDRELAADMRAHIELLARDLERDGMSSADALDAARRQVGNVTQLREQSREFWGFPAVDMVLRDVRYALRRSIVSGIAGERGELSVFILDNNLENTLLSALAIAQQAGPVSLDNIPVEPNLLNQLQNTMPVVKEKLRKEGHPPILTVMPQLRPLLARYARVFSPGLHVLSQNEIPERVAVNVLGTLG